MCRFASESLACILLGVDPAIALSQFCSLLSRLSAADFVVTVFYFVGFPMAFLQEFYFKCAMHPTGDNEDSVALHMVRANTIGVECAACTDKR